MLWSKVPPYLRIAVVLLVLLPPAASADWQGKLVFTVHESSGKVEKREASIHVKGDKERFDATSKNRSMSVITNYSDHLAILLDPSDRIATEMSFESHSKNYPGCNVSSMDSCYSGMKEIGSDTVGGHNCTVYEQKLPNATVKVWRPKDLKEIPALKFTVSNEKGLFESELTDIKYTAQKDEDFLIPKDYEIHLKGAPGDASGKIRRYTVEGNWMVPEIRPGTAVSIDTEAYKSKEPERGDIIGFRPQGLSKGFGIARIVALTKERVEFRNEVLFITGREVHENEIAGEDCQKILSLMVNVDQGHLKNLSCYEENLFGTRHSIIRNKYPGMEKSAAVEVWGDSYYVLSDDRSGTSSASELNRIKKDQIIGKLVQSIR